MNTVWLFWVGVLGLLMGSFFNATAGRWGTSRQNAPRSKCWQCGSRLTAMNLIPLLSWLFQRGRCSSCFSKVSWRYPLVEIFTMVLFVAAYLVTVSLLEFLFVLAVFSLMIMIVLIDYDQFIIPHELSLPLVFLAFASLFIDIATLQLIVPTIGRLASGPVLGLFFWGLWLLTKGQGMGFADGTLALAIGWLLGMSQGITAVMISFWVGLIVTLSIMLVQYLRTGGSHLGMKSKVPFGPFLVAGFMISYIFDVSLFYLYVW